MFTHRQNNISRTHDVRVATVVGVESCTGAFEARAGAGAGAATGMGACVLDVTFTYSYAFRHHNP